MSRSNSSDHAIINRLNSVYLKKNLNKSNSSSQVSRSQTQFALPHSTHPKQGIITRSILPKVQLNEEKEDKQDKNVTYPCSLSDKLKILRKRIYSPRLINTH